MSVAQKRLEKAELRRRLNLAAYARQLHIEAEYVVVEDPATGRVYFAPSCHEFLSQQGIAWGQTYQQPSGQMIHLELGRLTRSQSEALAHIETCDMRQLDGGALEHPPENVAELVALLCSRDLDCGALGELVPVIASVASGRFSYAHTTEHASDAFTHTEDPLSDHANWTALADGAYLHSTGSRVEFNWPVGANRDPVYRFNLADMSGETADYSVEGNTTTSYTSSKLKNLGPALRMTAADTYYYSTIRPHISPVDMIMWKRVAGAYTQLGVEYATGSASGIVRIEAVGSSLKAYYGGVATARITATDTAISAAGYAGIIGYVDAAQNVIDDAGLAAFKVLTAAYDGNGFVSTDDGGTWSPHGTGAGSMASGFGGALLNSSANIAHLNDLNAVLLAGDVLHVIAEIIAVSTRLGYANTLTAADYSNGTIEVKRRVGS